MHDWRSIRQTLVLAIGASSVNHSELVAALKAAGTVEAAATDPRLHGLGPEAEKAKDGLALGLLETASSLRVLSGELEALAKAVMQGREATPRRVDC